MDERDRNGGLTAERAKSFYLPKSASKEDLHGYWKAIRMIKGFEIIHRFYHNHLRFRKAMWKLFGRKALFGTLDGWDMYTRGYKILLKHSTPLDLSEQAFKEVNDSCPILGQDAKYKRYKNLDKDLKPAPANRMKFFFRILGFLFGALAAHFLLNR